jgi:hypothetical protein
MKPVTKQEILDGFGGAFTLPEAKEIMIRILDHDISDGYHTFGELYDHRCLLFINLCLTRPNLCAWKQDYEEWFALYCELDSGQISYHVPNKYRHLILNKIKMDVNYKFDGHNSVNVIERLGTHAASHQAPD